MELMRARSRVAQMASTYMWTLLRVQSLPSDAESDGGARVARHGVHFGRATPVRGRRSSAVHMGKGKADA